MTADTDIAIVGVGCRFPDADTPEQLWANLDAGLVSARPLSAEQLRAAGVSDESMNRPDYVRVAATLAAVDEFAAEFFGYLPAEAEVIDPQQRLFLEACWEALERAGHAPHPDAAGPQVGVFAGASTTAYTTLLQLARSRTDSTAALGDLTVHLGGGADFMAARVAHKLGLRGPSVAVQTACSSSLTAVHYATLSLLSGECDIALAGGAGVPAPAVGYRFQPGGILSQDGYCRAFDANSSGTSIGSGVGVVVLRRLADALASRDPVMAVVRGSAVGNDGAQRPGFTAPTPSGPAEVVSAALNVAGVGGEQLRYLEAHGSGTPLGDHVELLGLTEGLRRSSSRTGYCALGSVKANIGHTGAAAGIAGLIKAVHVANTGSLPGHPLFERPRDPGPLADSPFYIPTSAGATAAADRHVLVHSMGLGGTNAAVVLAAPPGTARPAPATPPVIRLQLSARTRVELDAASRLLADELDRGRLPLTDVAHTLRVGRHSFDHRRLVAGPPEQLSAALRLPRPGAAQTRRATVTRPLVAVAAPQDRAERVLAALAGAFGASLEVLDGAPEAVAANCFVVIVGDGDPGPNRHVLRLPADGDGDTAREAVEETLGVAWLHGVRVDWSALDGGGWRVALPTYPFQRRRYWALDDIGEPQPAEAAPVDDDVERDLCGLWRRLFGLEAIGLDDEFGALGGTSLLAVQMALEIQQRHGVLVNLHRVGGSRATVRRIADAVHAGAGGQASSAAADGDRRLVEADLEAPLAEIVPRVGQGGDVLLTGATGFVGAFLLHALAQATRKRIYCLVRAADEQEGRRRLSAAAARFRLPAPDLERAIVVPGDLRQAARVCEAYRGGELARRVGHVMHCAARVVFTEPYGALRADNVLGTIGLLSWMRASGIGDLSYVSSLAACGPTLGMGQLLPERREQPLDPHAGGYGICKWVGERLVDRAERDGMRVRVFRPCFIAGSTETGACNSNDLLWRLVATSLAVGVHPLDDRPVPIAPVDIVARAIVGLATSPASAGVAYHLVDAKRQTLSGLFATLAEAGHPTTGLPVADWLDRVAEYAVRTGDPVAASMALYHLDNLESGWTEVECAQWQGWLDQHGLSAAVDADQVLGSVRYLAERPEFSDLLMASYGAAAATRDGET